METKQKKVLFLITKSNWGGAQRYVFDIATHLDPIAFQPVVALGGDGELAHKLRAAGIRVISLPSLQRDISFFKELRSVLDLFRILRRERPQVLHVNSSKAGGLGALVGRLCRVPRIIYTAHGWAFNEERGVLTATLFGALHWLTILLAHQTIAVSKTLKAQMRWPFAARKMTVIRLGRAPIDFKSKDDARELIEMQVTGMDHGLVEFHHDQWIGTIAELHPIKNLPVAIAAVATLVHAFPRLRYVIIGEGELRQRLTDQIKNLGLEEHVFLVGALPEAARFLKAFDVFVLPSRSEAGAYVVLEAGLARVPVVASHVGGIPELVTGDVSGLLVPPGDAAALTRAIELLFTDTARATDLAETLAGTAHAFTLDRMVLQTAKMYTL